MTKQPWNYIVERKENENRKFTTIIIIVPYKENEKTIMYNGGIQRRRCTIGDIEHFVHQFFIDMLNKYNLKFLKSLQRQYRRTIKCLMPFNFRHFGCRQCWFILRMKEGWQKGKKQSCRKSPITQQVKKKWEPRSVSEWVNEWASELVRKKGSQMQTRAKLWKRNYGINLFEARSQHSFGIGIKSKYAHLVFSIQC